MTDKKLCVGKISGVYGIKGWVKVHSYTGDRENILKYSPWRLQKDKQLKILNVITGRKQGKTIVVSLEGIENRNDAELLAGWDVFIGSEQLPKIEHGEYYWADLVGLKVVTTDGIDLGVVDYLIETGANDVFVVAGDKERLIPFLQQQTIIKIDLEEGLMIVDWDPDF